MLQSLSAYSLNHPPHLLNRISGPVIVSPGISVGYSSPHAKVSDTTECHYLPVAYELFSNYVPVPSLCPRFTGPGGTHHTPLSVRCFWSTVPTPVHRLNGSRPPSTSGWS